jgi:hypothetical protein
MQLGRWAVVGALAVGAVTPSVAASAQDAPDPTDVGVAVLRQVCEQVWIEGACEAVGREDPTWRSEEDPSTGPLEQRVGVVHEHSGYSDGDPDTRPADYFEAGREGHNEADDGGNTGVIVDFLLSSEHSENEKLPITTAAVCIDPSSIPDGLAALDVEGVLPPLKCSNVEQGDAYRKWAETLAQAIEASEVDAAGEYVGFTAMRGFEWTNDYYNHLGVYFSRNVVNAKVDGSYVSMDVMWDWLRRSPDQGGGGDALVVFNHPGGLPALSPFDGDYPHNELLQELKGGANWNDVAYVPDVDDRVVGIEVNGGDDLSWYVRALTNGWHLGPVAAEDEHEREWSTSEDGKTLVLTRGRSPRDYYHAFHQRRTVAISRDLVGGAPGQPAVHPSVLFWAGPGNLQSPAATPLGGIVESASTQLRLDLAGLPVGSPVVLISDSAEAPIPVGTVDATGALAARHRADAPAQGEHWWFAVVCPPATTDCGSGERYSAVTAPIWLRSADGPSDPVVSDLTNAAGVLTPDAPVEPAIVAAIRSRAVATLPATGASSSHGLAALLLVAAAVGLTLRRRTG